jgi:hypothetical protein
VGAFYFGRKNLSHGLNRGRPIRKIKVGMTENEVNAILADWGRTRYFPRGMPPPDWQLVVYERTRGFWPEYHETVRLEFSGDPLVVTRTHPVFRVPDPSTLWDRIEAKLGW